MDQYWHSTFEKIWFFKSFLHISNSYIIILKNPFVLKWFCVLNLGFFIPAFLFFKSVTVKTQWFSAAQPSNYTHTQQINDFIPKMSINVNF